VNPGFLGDRAGFEAQKRHHDQNGDPLPRSTKEEHRQHDGDPAPTGGGVTRPAPTTQPPAFASLASGQHPGQTGALFSLRRPC
jgi:hypothetical protein